MTDDFVAKVVIEPDFSRFGPQLEQGLSQQAKPASDDYAKSLSLASQGKVDAAARAAATGYLKEVESAIVGLQSLGTSADKAIQLQIQTQLAQLTAIRNEIQVQLAKSRVDSTGNGILGTILHGGGHQALPRVPGAEGAGLLSVGARFGVIGIAATAAFQAIGKATEALKVDGDEAFTTEGKLRNMGAAILSADVIGAFQALDAHEKSASEKLKELKKEASTTPVDLRNLGNESTQAAQKAAQLADALDKVGGNGDFRKILHAAATDLHETADEAYSLARAMETAVTAANDVGAAMQRAGSDAAAFGEQAGDAGRGVGGIAAEGGRPRGAESKVDPSATTDSATSIRESIASRTKSLNDNLQVALKAENQARARFNRLKAAGIVEGAQDEYAKVVAATTKVAQIQQQIKDKEAQAAAQAKATRAQEAQDAQDEYAQGVANQATRLRLAADAADHVGATEQALLGFLRRERDDKKLTQEERLRYAGEYQSEASSAKQALVAAAKAEIDYQLGLRDLAIEKAKLTESTADDVRAYDRDIAYLDRLIAAAKKRGDKLEVLSLERQKTAAQLAKKGLKPGQQQSDGLPPLPEYDPFDPESVNAYWDAREARQAARFDAMMDACGIDRRRP